MTRINLQQSSKIKQLKSGQYKVPLKYKIQLLLNDCVLSRALSLENSEGDFLRYSILMSIKRKLTEADKSLKLSTPEMIVLSESETFDTASNTEKMYLWAFFNSK